MREITRLEDRRTGDVRYVIDHGEPQLLGPRYDTRAEAEAALQRHPDGCACGSPDCPEWSGPQGVRPS